MRIKGLGVFSAACARVVLFKGHFSKEVSYQLQISLIK